VTLAWRVTPPPAAVTVSVEIPVGVEPDVVTVSFDVTLAVDEIVTGFGTSVAVVAAGLPATDRVTSPVKPPAGVMVSVYVAVWPRLTLTLDGEAVRLKAGAGVPAPSIDATSERIAGSVA
jgi:hypothetical protein